MKKAYIYNPETFEFIKSVDATVDPETTKLMGRPCYALPRNATLVKVPELKSGEIAIFNKETRTWRVETAKVEEKEVLESNEETAQQAACRLNINKYAGLMKEIEVKYNEYMNKPVTYKGAKYLPRYIDDYSRLLNRKFETIDIWDCTGLACKKFTRGELEALYVFLNDLAEKAYKTKKENLQRCKQEIAKLEGKLNG